MVIYKIICATFNQRLFKLSYLQHPYQSNLTWQRGELQFVYGLMTTKISLNVCQRLPEGAKLFKTGCQLFIHGRFQGFGSKIKIKLVVWQVGFKRLQRIA